MSSRWNESSNFPSGFSPRRCHNELLKLRVRFGTIKRTAKKLREARAKQTELIRQANQMWSQFS